MTDTANLEFLFGIRLEPPQSILDEFLDRVATGPMRELRQRIGYGGKSGQSVYAHLIGGLFLLDKLRQVAGLSDVESRVLFTAYSIHDLNKIIDGDRPFRHLATEGPVADLIERYQIDDFFPDYHQYLAEIVYLIQNHPSHYQVGMQTPRLQEDSFTLDVDRVVYVVLRLIRAADAADLIHGLDHQTGKWDEVLHQINTSSDTMQYRWVSHRLDEQRGSFSNILHNAIVSYAEAQWGLIPLLFFPDGVAYLAPKAANLEAGASDWQRIAKKSARSIAMMVGQNYREFISRRPAGMKVDEKCLELGIPFEGEQSILNEMERLLQRAAFDVPDVAAKVVARVEKGWEKQAETAPAVAAEVEPLLTAPLQMIPSDEEGVRLGELVRSYYLFLKDHFEAHFDDLWRHLYLLFELPEERYDLYDFFEARYDRAYVVARDLTFGWEEALRRIGEDGTRLLAENERENPNASLLTDYLQHYARFSFQALPLDQFSRALSHYIENQHKQCVNCAAPFDTASWMSADVRSDVTVQAFSNRLRGGPGEPKKQICAVCHLQFLIEKLNYPEVRGEQTLYLHLYPYSFLTEPFIRELQRAIRAVLAVDPEVRAFHLNDLPGVLRAFSDQDDERVDFSLRTKAGKPHPFGLYLPRFAESIGNLLIFPLNPPTGNESARFLFALQYALILQREFGMKVLLSHAPVPPLQKEEISDFYVDASPLSLRGLLTQNDWRFYEGTSDAPGPLAHLWQTIGRLLTIRRVIYNPSSKRDELLTMVQALSGSAINMFYAVEKLLEQRLRDDASATAKEWLLIRNSQQIIDDIEALVHQIGGKRMEKLSKQLESLAELAWTSGLRGRSLEKNSLMTPLDLIFKALAHGSDAFDDAALRATIIEDTFEYLGRVADDAYQPGRKKFAACEQFVDQFFEQVLQGIYGGKKNRLMADEKALRSAFLFYLRKQIPSKKSE